jgi:hypothetical protein
MQALIFFFYLKGNYIILLCLKNGKTKMLLDANLIFFILRVN